MKFVKIIAMLLLIAMLGCLFVACDNGDVEETETEEPAPTGDSLVEKVITVSFRVFDSSAKRVYTVEDFKYKVISGVEPTASAVLEWYFKVENGDGYSTDEFGMIKRIGDYMIDDGQMWTVLDTVDFVDDNGNEIQPKELFVYPTDAGTKFVSAHTVESVSKRVLQDGDSFSVMIVRI